MAGTRISGLISGMDTESLVNSLVKVQQTKVDKVFQAKVKMEWKRDAYREINNALRSFKDDWATVTKQAQNMVSEANYKKFKVSWTGNSNGAVSISAGYSAQAKSHTIQSVSQLATAASASSRAISDGSSVSTSTTMKTIGERLGANGESAFEFDADGNATFTVDDVEITFNENDTLSSVMNKVSSSTNATLSYSQLTGQFTVASKTTGTGSTLSFDGDFFKAIGMAQNGDGSFKVDSGQNAKLKIDGVDVERSTNNFSVDGVNYTLNRTFNVDNDDASQHQSFNVERDVSSTVDMIKKFVETYNSLIDKLNGTKTQRPNKAFPPLTDEQRASMTDDAIKQWDEKAKSGMLYRDSGITNLMSNMRGMFYSSMGGTSKSMFSIGLTTTSSVLDGGKIQIDEDALTAALNKDPDEVFAMFGGGGDEKGLVRKLNDTINEYLRNSENNTLGMLDKQIRDNTDKISTMTSKLAVYEETQWKKFTAMEKALSALQKQTSALSSLLG